MLIPWSKITAPVWVPALALVFGGVLAVTAARELWREVFE